MTRDWRTIGAVIGFAALLFGLTAGRAMNSPDQGRNFPQIQSHTMKTSGSSANNTITLYLIKPVTGVGTPDADVLGTSLLGNPNVSIFAFWDISDSITTTLTDAEYAVSPESLAVFRSNACPFEFRKIRRWSFGHNSSGNQNLAFTIYNNGRVIGPTNFIVVPYVAYSWAIEADSIKVTHAGPTDNLEFSSLVW